MIIDLHFHTDRYSSCSRIPFAEGVKRAADMGLNALCLTEHDVFPEYSHIAELEKRFSIKVFTGVEINTVEGDILCFGMDRLPGRPIGAAELVSGISRIGGATIAAHPYRDNDRGIKDLAASLPGLTAIEAWNGNTSREENIRALKMAEVNGIPVTGASDSHRLDRIGYFATEFHDIISSEKELISALKSGSYRPVKYAKEPGRFIETTIVDK